MHDTLISTRPNPYAYRTAQATKLTLQPIVRKVFLVRWKFYGKVCGFAVRNFYPPTNWDVARLRDENVVKTGAKNQPEIATGVQFCHRVIFAHWITDVNEGSV